MIKQKDVEINLKVQKDERIIDIKVLEKYLTINNSFNTKG